MACADELLLAAAEALTGDLWRVPFVCTATVPTMTGALDDVDDTGSLVGTVTVRSFIGIDG